MVGPGLWSALRRKGEPLSVMRLSRGQLHMTYITSLVWVAVFHICGWAWTFGELELSAVGDTDLALNESSTGRHHIEVLGDAENL